MLPAPACTISIHPKHKTSHPSSDYFVLKTTTNSAKTANRFICQLYADCESIEVIGLTVPDGRSVDPWRPCTASTNARRWRRAEAAASSETSARLAVQWSNPVSIWAGANRSARQTPRNHPSAPTTPLRPAASRKSLCVASSTTTTATSVYGRRAQMWPHRCSGAPPSARPTRTAIKMKIVYFVRFSVTGTV